MHQRCSNARCTDQGPHQQDQCVTEALDAGGKGGTPNPQGTSPMIQHKQKNRGLIRNQWCNQHKNSVLIRNQWFEWPAHFFFWRLVFFPGSAWRSKDVRTVRLGDGRCMISFPMPWNHCVRIPKGSKRGHVMSCSGCIYCRLYKSSEKNSKTPYVHLCVYINICNVSGS